MEDIVRLPQMSFSESVKTVLSKLTDFKGRARRSELWWFWLLYAVVSVVLNLSLAGMQVVSSVVSMLLLLSICSVTVRRLHDRGHGRSLAVPVPWPDGSPGSDTGRSENDRPAAPALLRWSCSGFPASASAF